MAWIPLTVIQSVDGMLFMASPGDVVRDVCLFWLLALVPATVLALPGWLVTRIASWRPAGGSGPIWIGWAVTLLPLTWICTWQAIRTVWLWLRVILHADKVLIGPSVRLAAAGALVLLLLLLIRRVGAVALIRSTARQFHALRRPAFAVLVLAAVVTVAKPPAILHASTRLDPRPVKSAGPDILLISLDAMSAHDVSLCGKDGDWLPNMRRLALQSTCFSRDYASSNFTTPTTSTMDTGTLPWTHFATVPDARVMAGVGDETAAAHLRAAGYVTMAVSDNLLASPRYRSTYSGYDETLLISTNLTVNIVRDVVTVFPDSQLPKLAGTAFSFLTAFDMYLHGTENPYRSEQTFNKITELLRQSASPRFIWAHSLPPHSPYLPPADTRHRLLPPGELERWDQLLPDNIQYAPAQQALVDKHHLRYRESLMAADERLGVFLDSLRQTGRFDNTVIVLTADHGESFEKGYLGHAGNLLHDALIHIPLVIKLPAQRAGRVIDMPVSEADLAQTLLNLAPDAQPLGKSEGRSLVPLLTGGTMPPVPVFSMAMETQSRFKPLKAGNFAVIDGSLKLTLNLRDGTEHLIDLVADPQEQADLATSRPADARRLDALLRDRIAQAETQRQRTVHTP